MMATADVTITPDMMAQAFWDMGSDQQVEFFAALASVINADKVGGNDNAYTYGELQWFFTGNELMKADNKVAKEMLMTMAAPSGTVMAQRQEETSSS